MKHLKAELTGWPRIPIHNLNLFPCQPPQTAMFFPLPLLRIWRILRPVRHSASRDGGFKIPSLVLYLRPSASICGLKKAFLQNEPISPKGIEGFFQNEPIRLLPSFFPLTLYPYYA